MKTILGFDRLLMPSVLVFFYWISMLVILVGGLYVMFTVSLVYYFFCTIFGLISCRMTFELIMVAFKNNEYLRRIAENTQETSAE
ncbi:DUF4282 domain-containing protein [Pseudocitrobacter cyperus]|uniref:DUF4282 domain-containing protein n=1 Tax=Pseudocitrobacter cyperus TaxID=3112843 RepID=A0ABV0HHT1_9ENTR